MDKFYKVSDEQIRKDWMEHHWPISGENSLEDAKFIIPRRATAESAGYDIFSPINLLLRAGASIVIPTGLKVELDPGHFLMIVPRSGLGFKYRIGLANTVGIIDRDYYNNSNNEGHIMVKLVNNGEKDCRILAGTAICQGIILPFDICSGDKASLERTGGLGSTDKEEV